MSCLCQKKGYVQLSKNNVVFMLINLDEVNESMANDIESLAKRKREKDQAQGCFESLFNSSPWINTLISTLLGSLLILLLVNFGPCILNRLVQFMKKI